jgi:hypothetical protein
LGSFSGDAVMTEVVYSKEVLPQETEHPDSAAFYYRCPVCGEQIDWRDLDALVLHVGPLPHPVEH